MPPTSPTSSAKPVNRSPTRAARHLAGQASMPCRTGACRSASMTTLTSLRNGHGGRLRPQSGKGPSPAGEPGVSRQSRLPVNDEIKNALAVGPRISYIMDFPHTGARMATRQMKMPVKDDSAPEIEAVMSHSKRPERGRYLLQVDRQTKGSYTALDAAQAAALAIKKAYPIVQVSVYDSVDNSNTMIEAPAKA